MMNVEIIKSKLKSSSLCEAGKAYELLASGAELVVNESVIDVASSGILETYRIRAKNISDRSGEHAQRLTHSTLEFVQALESRNPKELKTAHVVSPDLGYFLIWVDPSSNDLIGCCYLIKNNEVTERAWSQMWDNT
ncbi:hypothetical protein [Thalassolituus marinus]|uniref:Uncharacterized protein n=1 Tax=Thalassolituus marinus TaxID=671053 RepID=A0ABS7ZY43_9GAMM|nr:hypothetical protein [Thalassolituus marinus]MCA6065535.1 hypothetical protein [Thalassolituus marinus]